MTDWQKDALRLAQHALNRYSYFCMADLEDLTDRLAKLMEAVVNDDEKRAKIQATMIQQHVEEN